MSEDMNSKIQQLLKSARSPENENESSVSVAERHFSSDAETIAAFAAVKKKMRDIGEWNNNSSMMSFQLFDAYGREVESPLIAEGLFNRVHMKASGKYDWIEFIEIYETADETVITVRPTYDPTAEPPDKQHISHFMTSESANNFCLLKHENSVKFYVVGLCEKQNTTETASLLEDVRNVFVSNFGYYSGFQKREWNTFCENFLNS